MDDFWVFGYGSLMWRPGFDHLEVEPARLMGAHRALCVYSWVHRGTPEKPGLVLGLDRGGSCRGLAFRIDPGERQTIIAYLRDREQVTQVYKEAMRRVMLPHGRQVAALTYVVDRRHDQYAGALDLVTQGRLVRSARGRSGDNVDYVISTARRLKELAIADPALEALAKSLQDGEG